ncbi:MAG: hypothetical protein MJ138_01320 [Kiritimatiellae bacterium]|nr:hypothetical protein [Kiritimatiellia bacterium]
MKTVLAWRRRFARQNAHLFFGADTTPGELAEWCREIARELDARPRRLNLVVHGAEGVDAWLDFDPADGEMVARVDGRGEAKFSLRRRWLPEHPVPLRLSRADAPSGTRTLLVDPVDANRFRVRHRFDARSRTVWSRVFFGFGFAGLCLFVFCPHPAPAVGALAGIGMSVAVKTVSDPRE